MLQTLTCRKFASDDKQNKLQNGTWLSFTIIDIVHLSFNQFIASLKLWGK